MLWNLPRPLVGAFYFLRLVDSQGRQLFTVNTNNVFEADRKGSHEVWCCFDNNVLVPGEYWLTFGCFMKPKTVVHQVENALGLFVVENARVDPTRGIAVRSIFDPRPSWRVEG
jgi:hypothetical protein